jgi:quercetin dioxygenase-like cupin family protein
MTFGYYDTEQGADLHEHSHPNEETWHVIAGELEVTIGGEVEIVGPGCVAIVPPDTTHSTA